MAAYATAKPGDIILLDAGVYTGPFELTKSGEPGKPIVFRGAGDGEAILEADGTSGKSTIVSIGGADHLMFENLTFRSAQRAIYAGKPGSVGLPCVAARSVTSCTASAPIRRTPATGTSPITRSWGSTRRGTPVPRSTCRPATQV